MSETEYRPLKSPFNYEDTMKIGQLYMDTLNGDFYQNNNTDKKYRLKALEKFSLDNLITLKEIPHLMDVFHYLTVENGDKDKVSFNAVIETKILNDNDIEINSLRKSGKKSAKKDSKEEEPVMIDEPVVTEKQDSFIEPDDKYGINTLKKLVDLITEKQTAKKEVEQKKSDDMDMLSRLNDTEITVLLSQLGLVIPEDFLTKARSKHKLFMKFVEEFGKTFVVDNQEKFDRIAKFLDESRQ